MLYAYCTYLLKYFCDFNLRLDLPFFIEDIFSAVYFLLSLVLESNPIKLNS